MDKKIVSSNSKNAEPIREVFWTATPAVDDVLYASPAYESVWGRSLESLRQQPQSFHEAIHPEDREQAIAIRKRQRDNGFDIEYRIVRPDGTVRWIRDRGFPVKDNSGKVYRMAGISEDITERKQSEDLLRKNEDRIRLIIDTIPTMAWTLEPDGTVDFVNQRWLDYTGIPLEEPLRIIHPEDLPRVMEKWRASMSEGKPSEDEMRLQRADGEYRWFLVRSAPLHDEQGNLVKWYGVSIDIEDNKQLGNALRESERRYLSLFENMAEGVAYFRMLFKDDKLQDAIYLEVNPAWENLTGLRNVIGRKITEVLPGILEANSEFFERSVRVALTGQSERFEAYSTQLKKWLSVSAYCPKEEHVIVVLDDISERKQAEEKLKQVNSELHSLSSHLQNIQENERTAIAREMHDELGQLLTALKMEVGWLTKKMPDDAVLKEKGNEILSLVSEMLKTVKRIAMDLRPNILDELGLIAALEWQGHEFEKTKEIQFQFHTNLNDFNPERNLATNIFRVHQEALTNIARHAQATRIETTLETKDNWLRLVIKDNGNGFDVDGEKHENSFGLIGMKERALMLHGELVVESVKRSGTVITLNVPLPKTEKKES